MDPAEFRATARESFRTDYLEGRIDEHELANMLTTFAEPSTASSSDADGDADGM